MTFHPRLFNIASRTAKPPTSVTSHGQCPSVRVRAVLPSRRHAAGRDGAVLGGWQASGVRGRERGDVECIRTGRRHGAALPFRPIPRPSSRPRGFGVCLQWREWPRGPSRRNATLALLQYAKPSPRYALQGAVFACRNRARGRASPSTPEPTPETLSQRGGVVVGRARGWDAVLTRDPAAQPNVHKTAPDPHHLRVSPKAPSDADLLSLGFG